MRYVMKAGTLFNDSLEQPTVTVRKIPWSQERILQRWDSPQTMKTGTESSAPPERRGDVRHRQYYLAAEDGTILMRGYPAYGQGEDPDAVGWPVCRPPRVDHAAIDLGSERYHLAMLSSQRYSMRNSGGSCILEVLHRGLSGGWDILAQISFPPETVAAIYLFCRYLEQENEFLVV